MGKRNGNQKGLLKDSPIRTINPIARSLRSGVCQPRTIRSKKAYDRKRKVRVDESSALAVNH